MYAKSGEDQLSGKCAADHRNIFNPYSGLQIRVCIGKLFYISHLNQAGVPCSLTNSTGKFDFNPKHMLRVLKRTVSIRRFF